MLLLNILNYLAPNVELFIGFAIFVLKIFWPIRKSRLRSDSCLSIHSPFLFHDINILNIKTDFEYRSMKTFSIEWWMELIKISIVSFVFTLCLISSIIIILFIGKDPLTFYKYNSRYNFENVIKLNEGKK